MQSADFENAAASLRLVDEAVGGVDALESAGQGFWECNVSLNNVTLIEPGSPVEAMRIMGDGADAVTSLPQAEDETTGNVPSCR